MAAITFKIGGKYDNKGVSAAQKGIQNLTGAAKAFNLAVKGFVVSKVFEGVNIVVNGSTDAFKAQNKALTQFNSTMQKSAKITAQGASKIREAIDKISTSNFFDGDSLNNAASLAANLGLDAAQVTKVIDAATNMAAAGIMPLDNAVKALSLSLSGNVTQLKRIAPELDTLTEEELANGTAVDILQEKYAGFRDVMANTFSGRETQFKNTFSDLQASIGSVFQSISFVSQGKLLEPMQKLITLIDNNRAKIINVFLRLPEVAQAAFNEIGAMIEKTFTGEGFSTLFSALGQMLADSLIYGIKMGANSLSILKNTFQSMLASGDPDSLLVLWGSLIAKCVNKSIEGINKFIEAVQNNSVLNSLMSFITGGRSDSWTTIDFDFTTDPQEIADMQKAMRQSLNSSNASLLSEQKKLIADLTKKLAESAKGIGSFYSDNTSSLISELERILGQDLPEDLKAALSGTPYAGDSGSSSDDYGTQELAAATATVQSSCSLIASALSSLGSIFEPVGTVISAFAEHSKSAASALQAYNTNMVGVAEGTELAAQAQKGYKIALEAADAAFKSTIIGLIIALVVKLANALADVSPAMSEIMDGLDTIMSTIANIIGDTMDEFLTPLANLLAPIGEILGNILLVVATFLNLFTPILELITNIVQALSPIIGILAALIVMLLNFIPIFKLIGAVCGYISKAIKAFYNAIVSFFKKLSIPYGFSISWSGISVKWKSLASIIGLDTASDSEESSSDSSSSTSSSSASYTAAKDVYVTINVDRSYVNGDAQAIAIMLAREIKNAEKMNLV